jgi:hypothetical protein
MSQPRKLDIPLERSTLSAMEASLKLAILNKPGKASLRALSPHQISSQKGIFEPSAGSYLK